MEAAKQAAAEIPSKIRQQFFVPQETLDHPFDVTLVVEDGKESKAHRGVLSEASPFFEKLFNSDMRESNEGVIRFEMLTEASLSDILEFIYTRIVQITAEDNARDLIAMADYLVLPHLKTIAGKFLAQKLNASNSISTYHFAEKYRCDELISDAKNFIFENFATVAATEDFLNLSSEQVKMWISSDEINVGAEEDVFKIILTWIDHEKKERKEHFAELFCEVRLVYVSRDFLHSDIVTNDLVNNNEGCMGRVKDAIKFTASKDYIPLSVEPRKSLEIPVVVVYLSRTYQIPRFYYPRENSWSRFPATDLPGIFSLNSNSERFKNVSEFEFSEFSGQLQLASCSGKLYFMPSPGSRKILHYDSFSNRWEVLPYTTPRRMLNVFVRNDKEIYALVSEDRSCPICQRGNWFQYSSREWPERMLPCGRRHVSVITKYIPESNSWEDITSFDWGMKERMCVVAKDNFIYFLGGSMVEAIGNYTCPYETLRDANRYDLSTNTWNKIADLQESRCNATGGAAYGKIFILGGLLANSQVYMLCIKSCEVYDETADEWHFIASLPRNPYTEVSLAACADNKLYALTEYVESICKLLQIMCYDPDKNEWIKKTTGMPKEEGQAGFHPHFHELVCCPMRVFKGTCLAARQDIGPSSLSMSHNRSGKCKCTIM